MEILANVERKGSLFCYSSKYQKYKCSQNRKGSLNMFDLYHNNINDIQNILAKYLFDKFSNSEFLIVKLPKQRHIFNYSKKWLIAFAWFMKKFVKKNYINIYK